MKNSEYHPAELSRRWWWDGDGRRRHPHSIRILLSSVTKKSYWFYLERRTDIDEFHSNNSSVNLGSTNASEFIACDRQTNSFLSVPCTSLELQTDEIRDCCLFVICVEGECECGREMLAGTSSLPYNYTQTSIIHK